jgi:hypothetical protein
VAFVPVAFGPVGQLLAMSFASNAEPAGPVGAPRGICPCRQQIPMELYNNRHTPHCNTKKHTGCLRKLSTTALCRNTKMPGALRSDHMKQKQPANANKAEI